MQMKNYLGVTVEGINRLEGLAQGEEVFSFISLVKCAEERKMQMCLV